MFSFLPALKRVSAALLCLLALSLPLLLTACGGSASSTPGSTSSTANEWTWMSGSNSNTLNATGTKIGVNIPGVYGTLDIAAASNVPGSRYSAVSWTDSSGNLWLFGGAGFDSTGTVGELNDLWKFNLTSKEWTWVSGSNAANASSVYGTLGVPAASNVPGSRAGSVSWTDSSGNLWIFGGGYFGFYGPYFNDLWEFNPTSKEWTWVSGSNTYYAVGIYGTLGNAAAGNVPGCREGSVSWTDTSGNLWLFGGYGMDSTGTFGELNDLWKFNLTNKEWIWVSGASTTFTNGGQPGIYGTLGTPSASNVPGGREGSVSWIDSRGNLWLFGGNGYVLAGAFGGLNDLWEFNPATKQWTWVSGSNTADVQGTYGTLGVAAAGNVPGNLAGSASWIDSTGNLWLFGGQGGLNDLWEFNPTNKEWTWVSGTGPVGTSNLYGSYGTLGIPSASNVPGGRNSSVSWTDSSGNLWLFGGQGGQNNGSLNDLWRYQP